MSDIEYKEITIIEPDLEDCIKLRGEILYIDNKIPTLENIQCFRDGLIIGENVDWTIIDWKKNYIMTLSSTQRYGQAKVECNDEYFITVVDNIINIYQKINMYKSDWQKNPLVCVNFRDKFPAINNGRISIVMMETMFYTTYNSGNYQYILKYSYTGDLLEIVLTTEHMCDITKYGSQIIISTPDDTILDEGYLCRTYKDEDGDNMEQAYYVMTTNMADNDTYPFVNYQLETKNNNGYIYIENFSRCSNQKYPIITTFDDVVYTADNMIYIMEKKDDITVIWKYLLPFDCNNK